LRESRDRKISERDFIVNAGRRAIDSLTKKIPMPPKRWKHSRERVMGPESAS
jgi:hypothetical protein